MVLAAAKAFSASSVAITDIRPDNLPVAKQLGAKHALDQSKATSANDTVEALKAVFAEGPDIVIDCVGFESTITVSLQSMVHGTADVCFVMHVFSHPRMRGMDLYSSSSSSSSSSLSPCCNWNVIAKIREACIACISKHDSCEVWWPAMWTVSSVLCICFGDGNIAVQLASPA